MKPLVSSEPHLLDTIATSVEVALQNLMQDMNSFSINTDDQVSSTFKREIFPLDELISTNKSILDAISSLEPQMSRKLM